MYLRFALMKNVTSCIKNYLIASHKQDQGILAKKGPKKGAQKRGPNILRYAGGIDNV